MKEHHHRLLFSNVNGGRRLPLQDVFLAARLLRPLVGIGRDLMQAIRSGTCLEITIQSLQGFAIFGLIFPGESAVYTYHRWME